MMEEELERFCSNCKKDIRAANFEIHTAFCYNHITICKICDEPVQKKSFKQHEDEFHISVLCDLCNISLQKWMLPKHQELCPKRRMICEFCEGDFPFDEYKEHTNFCGSRTEKCVRCSKYIMLKDEKVHSEYHLYMETRGTFEGEMDQNMMNELITHSSTKELKSNDKTSSKNLGEKYNSYGTDDFSSVIGATSSSPNQLKQEPTDYTQCHLCDLFVSWTDYRSHLKICSAEFKKCPHCDQAIQNSKFKEHITINCPLIKESNTKDRFASSAKECKSLSDFKDDFSARENQTLVVCPLCNEQYFSDEVMKHINICSKNTFQCELCYETVLHRDKNSHLNLKCKMLQEKSSPDYYECPLCCEKLLEKDKTKHESFECRMLLEADIGPLYSLPDEKNSRKFHKETQKNLVDDPYQLATHKKSCNKTSKKECVYCDKMIDVDLEKKHLENNCEVYRQMKKISNTSKDDHYKGAKPKSSNFSEVVQPEMAKCSYCKTTLNKNILFYHEKECVYQKIKCEYCLKSVLLKDLDSHGCKSHLQHNRKERGRGERKTEKNEKNESRSFWNIFKPLNPAKSLDQYQNDVNQSYEMQMENRFTSFQYRNNEDLYFPSSIMDNPMIPCEFCNESFPASEIVLHSTGCNKDVSLPQKVYSETTLNSSSKQFKKDHESATATQDFFSVDEKTSAKHESIRKRLKQRSVATPGEYLSPDSKLLSKSEMLYSYNQIDKKEYESPSALKSVWNTDVPDVEMKEVDPKTSSTIFTQEKSLIENSEKSLYEAKKYSSDSDEEVSSMMDFIEGKTDASSNVKSEKNFSLTIDEPKMQSEVYTDEDRRQSKESFKNAFRYILNAEEMSDDEFTKETTVNTNIVCNDLKDPENSDDEASSIYKSDKLQSKMDVNRTESDWFSSEKFDVKKQQIASNSSEAESTLDKYLETNQCNFSVYDSRMKNSLMATENRQSSEVEEQDLYYKTDALGFISAPEDENSIIRRPKKKEFDMDPQISILSSKYGHPGNIIQPSQEVPANKTSDISFLSETSKKLIALKKKYSDYSTLESKHNERGESKTQNESSGISEKTLEILRSKYEYQNDGIEKNETEQIENETQEVSSVAEKPFEMSKHYTVCPVCKQSVRWIDYNIHVPTCATASGKCSRCGKKVPSSELKDHFLSNCSKLSVTMKSMYDRNAASLNSKSVCNRNAACLESDTAYEGSAASLKSRIDSYDQIFKPLTSNEDYSSKKKSGKLNCDESNENKTSKIKQAFRIKPDETYRNHHGVSRHISSHEEDTKAKQLKEADEQSERYYIEDVDKWRMWRNAPSDDI